MFHHTQTIGPGGTVRSVQTLDLPCEVAPHPDLALEAGAQYWTFLHRFGAPLLQIPLHDDRSVDIHAAGVLLLSFDAPALVTLPEGVALRYPINRGAVVQPAGAGQGYLQMGLERTRVSLAVEGFRSRLVGANRHPLRKLFYLGTQSALHVLIARRYLTALAARLSSDRG